MANLKSDKGITSVLCHRPVQRLHFLREAKIIVFLICCKSWMRRGRRSSASKYHWPLGRIGNLAAGLRIPLLSLTDTKVSAIPSSNCVAPNFLM